MKHWIKSLMLEFDYTKKKKNKSQETLFLAANSVGGVVGKMISPQSIAIACAAVGLVGKESDLFKFTLKYSLAFIILIGIWTAIIAMFIPYIIPEAVALVK